MVYFQCRKRGLVSLWRRAYSQNVRPWFLYQQYTNFLYFNLYLNNAHTAHYIYFTFWIFPACYFEHWVSTEHSCRRWQCNHLRFFFLYSFLFYDFLEPFFIPMGNSKAPFWVWTPRTIIIVLCNVRLHTQ